MAKRFLINVGAVTGARVFVVLSQVLVLPVVARYLAVEDFGDIALAMTVVIFANLLSDGGLSRSLIRRNSYDRTEWSSVFWFLVLVGIGLGAILMAIAPLWEWMFARPKLGEMVTVLAVVPLLYSVAAVPNARMECDDRFPTIAMIQATGALAGIATAIIFAVQGAGAWALVLQQIVLGATQCVLSLTFGRFRPMAPWHRVPLGDHLVFARNSLAVSVLLTGQRQAPTMMIGYVLGANPLGLFAMSQRLLNLPQQGLAGPSGQVVFVRMSAAQDSPERLPQVYLGSVRLLALAVFPPMAVIAGIGDTALPLLLSEPWRQVATIFALAAPGIALETATYTSDMVFQAVNRTGLRLRLVAERSILKLAAIAVALPFGLNAVALAITLSAVAYMPRLWAQMRLVIRLDNRSALLALLPSIAGAALAWGMATWLQAMTDGWATLAWSLPLLMLAWAATAAIQIRGLRTALSMFS